MAARSLDLLINVQAGTIISAFDSTVQGNIPGFVFGDSTPVSVRLVEPSGVQARPWKEIDLTGQSVRIGIGIPGASPTAGAYTLTYGGDTTAALAYNATATQIAAALNALPSITSAGGVTITSTANAFKVIFESNGARTALTADTGSLSPTSGAYISTVLEGANDAAAIYLVKLEAMPAAYEELADNLPTAAIHVSTVREGAAGVSEIQTLSIDPLPYDGTYTLSVAGQETSSLNYDAAATDIQSALELLSGIGTGNVTVSGEFPAFSITFAASRGNVGTMVGNASALTVPTGRRGVLSNNTTGIAELLASRARIDAMLEIEITDNISGDTWTPLQAQCVVREDVIPASPASQTPMPVFLTEFMVVNRFLAFDDAQTLSPTQKTQAAENLGLGTASTVDTGTAEGEIPLLGVGGKLASSLLPSLSLTDIIAVADQAARLALVSGEAYGKIVKQADNGRSYALPTGAAAATAGNWIELGDAAITAADIQDATSAGRDLFTAVNAAAQVALLGAETPAGAQAKADAALASALAADVTETTASILTKLAGITPESGKIGEEYMSKSVQLHNSLFSVKDYGAIADGTTDCTGAFNAAIAAAFNAGGGTVWIPDGHYKFTGSLNTTTNSVLTCPQTTAYNLQRRTIRIIGERAGYLTNGNFTINEGGVILDFSSINGSGIKPSAIGFAPYIPNTYFGNINTEWNDINVTIDGFTIVTKGAQLTAINGSNILNLSVGNDIKCIARALSPSSVLLSPNLVDPTDSGTAGIVFPVVLNNIILNCGSCIISGYDRGIEAGEHLLLSRPQIIFNRIGLYLNLSSHLISGEVSLENCNQAIRCDTFATIHLIIQAELSDQNTWFKGSHGLFGGNIGGYIAHVSWNKNAGQPNFPINGGLFQGNGGSPDLTILDLRTGIDASNTKIIKRSGISDFAQIVFVTGEDSLLELSMRGGSNDLAIYDHQLGYVTASFEHGNGVFAAAKMKLYSTPPAYASDAAAAADAALVSGSFYTLANDTVLRRKP